MPFSIHFRSGLLNQGFDVERNSGGYGSSGGRNSTMDDDNMTPQQYRQRQEQIVRGEFVFCFQRSEIDFISFPSLHTTFTHQYCGVVSSLNFVYF